MIIVDRLITGGYVVATIHNGVRVAWRYFGYPKREAVRLFKQELKQHTNKGTP